MTRYVRITLLFLGLCGLATQATRAQSTDGTRYAVIISGIGGEPAYVEQHSKWADGIYTALQEESGLAPDRLFLLVENPSGVARKSSLEEIRAVFTQLSLRVCAQDILMVILIGHGSASGTEARINLPGPDLSASMLNDLLQTVPAGRLVVINGASASGPFIDALSGENRVIITATKSGGERLATVFPEHFLASLSVTNSDLDKDGQVSALEAFNYTRLKTAEWYEQQGRLATEHPLLDDNGDGLGSREPGKEGTDGALARSVRLGGKASAPPARPLSSEKNARFVQLEARAQELQKRIDALKRDKDTLAPGQYTSRLEDLLVQLAQVNKEIRGLRE